MKTLLLSLLLAASPVLAATSQVQVYTARAEGSLTIGTDGRVLDVELTSDAALGAGVLDGYEKRIRTWRFEPVVEGGKPINARARMHLYLAAAREKGNPKATFGVRSVRFLDEPGTLLYARGSSLAPPGYPSNALRAGVGAEVMLLVKLDAQGRVQRVATEQLALLGVASRQPHQANLATQFRRAAEKAVAQWTLAGHPDGQVLRVPVRFSVDRQSGWIPTAVQPVDLPEWAVLERATEQATQLSDGGVATAGQFKLLTPLDEA
jgi:outer membrane biosynthesis protein TonB